MNEKNETESLTEVTGSEKRLALLSRIIEEYPASWMVLGAFLVLLGGGNNFSVLGLTAPGEIWMKTLLIVMGITLFVTGLYIVLKGHFKNKLERIGISIPLTLLWFCTVGFLGYRLYNLEIAEGGTIQKRYVENSAYDKSKGRYNVRLIRSSFREVNGGKLAFVCAFDDPSQEQMDDARIDYQERNIPLKSKELFLELAVPCKKVNRKVRYGDRVQLYVFHIPEGVQVLKPNTIGEIMKAGARKLTVDNTGIGVDLKDPAMVYRVYRGYKGRNKRQFLLNLSQSRLAKRVICPVDKEKTLSSEDVLLVKRCEKLLEKEKDDSVFSNSSD